MTEPNLGGSHKKKTEQKYLIYKMGNFRELKNAQNICSFTDINCRKWVKKYLRNQVFENVVFLHIRSPQISPLFSLYKIYNSYNLFSANRAFPLHVVLLIST